MGERVVLAGGSGFLGVSLAKRLIESGRESVILTRGKTGERNGLMYVHWDGEEVGDWAKYIEGAAAVVNFTGKSVNCIYTPKNKKEIYDSRLRSVAAVEKAILSCSKPPKVVVQAGSLAIYGDTRKECDEGAPHGTGFSVDVCEKWEEAFYRNDLPHTRKVLLRIGFALGRDGGALEPLVKLARAGLGGTIGSGNQYISWIHIDDLNEMFIRAIEDENVRGTYNATGPKPVTNREFMAALRRQLGKGWAPPAPTPFVILGAYTVMRASPSLALTGRNCIPARLVEEGFTFRHNELSEALKDLVEPAAISR